jgi:hypothetical protein
MMRLFMRLSRIFAALPARRRSFARLAVPSLLLLMSAGGNSYATFIVNLTNANGNFNNTTYPAPYGTVAVTRTSNNTATIVVTPDAGSHGSGGYYYLFGDGGAIALSVNGTGTLSFSNVSTTSPFPPGTFNVGNGGSGTQDGFGFFNFSINTQNAQGGQGGASTALSSLSFTLTAQSATWLTDTDVLTSNNKGNLASSHLFAYSGAPSTSNDSAALTAFVGNGPPVTSVPEPATVVMLATGLPIGLLALRRRLRGYPATV